MLFRNQRKKRRLNPIKVLIFLLLTNCYLSSAQEICVKVDSLVIHYLPWDLKTYLSLSDTDVENFEDSTFHKIEIIKNREVIENFITALQEKKEYLPTLSIDPRLVVICYLESGYIEYLSFDSDGFFSFRDKLFIRNPKLVEWINSEVTPMR